MKNPLLSLDPLPAFDSIKAEHVVPAILPLLEEHLAALPPLLSQDHFTWDNLIEPLTEKDVTLAKRWACVSHLHGVMNSPALNEAYEACLPKLSEYSTTLSQHPALYKAIQAIVDDTAFVQLSPAKQKALHNALRDFRLSGVDLPADKKQQYADCQLKLADLTNQYQQHLLDATNAWTWHTDDASHLAGLPEHAIEAAKETAEGKGYTLTLQAPCYLAVMSYADDRALREKLYRAFTTRASDLGQHAEHDNTQTMDDILRTRHETAQLVGFNSFADYSLATKMAKTTEEVDTFLQDLAKRALPYAKKEMDELRAFAVSQGCDTLHAWDIAYYSEKQRQALFNFNDEMIRPYFPLHKALEGLFWLVGQLYDVTFKARTDVSVWHEHVQFFDVFDKNEQLQGQFYVDLFARPHKRSGAWMDDLQGRHQFLKGQTNIPIAFLVCNFSAPLGDKPALLTHDDVITLFHECGHTLHHLLTKIDCLDVSGINGVAWDAVELPSQFMENWCWDRTIVDKLSGHYETGTPLPDALFQNMLDAKHFQAGMHMVRQLEFSLFDFTIHANFDPKAPSKIQSTLNDIRETCCVTPIADFNRFQHGFSHIFAGGYAAGYYSYKWAEVLSSDAFSRFEEEGLFNKGVAQDFLNNILSQGGVKDADVLFAAFRGRAPTVDALLRHNGLSETTDFS